MMLGLTGSNLRSLILQNLLYFHHDLKFSFTQCGKLAVIAVPKYGSKNDTESKATSFAYEINDTNTSFPSSYQIFKGLNQTNLPVVSKTLYVNTPSDDIYINMTGFPYDKLVYEVYFTTQNYFTYYPKLAENDSVAAIEIKTLKRRSQKKVFFH